MGGQDNKRLKFIKARTLENISSEYPGFMEDFIEHCELTK